MIEIISGLALLVYFVLCSVTISKYIEEDQIFLARPIAQIPALTALMKLGTITILAPSITWVGLMTLVFLGALLWFFSSIFQIVLLKSTQSSPKEWLKYEVWMFAVNVIYILGIFGSILLSNYVASMVV